MDRPSPVMQRLPVEYGHTCMNHFLVIDHRGRGDPDMTAFGTLAARLCATPLADDILLLTDTARADVRLRIVGGDRREGEFCGNGLIYIAAKVGTELGREQITVETASGLRTASRAGRCWKVEMGTGEPLDSELAQVQATVLAGVPVVQLLRVGEPHLVMTLPPELPGFHIERTEFEDYCRRFRDITALPGGVSVTMVFQQETDRALIRTWERGVRRHTFSCGTGSVCAIAALYGVPPEDRVFHVCAPGGMHEVLFEQGHWYLQAVPQPIAGGWLADEKLELPLAGLHRYAP